ncbi:FUSC family protein [Bradyrhizobium sp. WSM471]|uniref:FUSC family protein n=1 Tax=Bradyrhizobium sp. WSM471 TaxID=319017 RepID=UPI00024D2C5F|nr:MULTISPECIES: FUSC family protein [Bradyrhizobium]EHR03144.1 putative membrane protein [Bradyrhizobium sp. WSM471]UFW38379.1 FUSC family protein [Bradyrhizobium canariense]
MSQRSSFWARHAALVFSIRTFSTAMLAFSIALWLGMPRPYWAMASVYITSNQLAGATSSKAAYRMLGTLIGATATIALIPNLVNAPELLSLAVALWVGLCLYLSLIDGTPRSYMFMLAGYTVALLGLPVLSMPEATFDIVSSRVQEIMLGIVCASIASTLVLPQSASAVIKVQVDAWLGEARRLGVDVLTGRGSNEERNDHRMRLAAAASEIDQLSWHLAYETSRSAGIARGLQRLRQHMLALIPLLASIEDQRVVLGARDLTKGNVDDISRRVARWLADGGEDEEKADGLRAALDEARPQLGANAAWIEIVIAGFVSRMRNLVDIVQDCRRLREAVAEGRDPEAVRLAFMPDAVGVAELHRDHGLALWTAAATTSSILVCCAFWIASGWTDGASAPIFAAVLGSLFAGVDNPLPAFRKLYPLFLAVIAVNGIYSFGLLPRATTLEMVIVMLLPTFVLFGWIAARPATARIGALLTIYTSVQLALDSSYSADFSSFANSSVALMVGVALTGIVSGIVRLFGAEWIASRLLRSNWTTLAAVAEGRGPQDGVAVASLMQHRLALLATRIAVVPAQARSDVANLRQMRTALNVIHLRKINVGQARPAIDAFLARLASVCRVHTEGRLSDELLIRLDNTIAATLQEPAGQGRDEALHSLAGIRVGLFPGAVPYQPHEPEQRSIAA